MSRRVNSRRRILLKVALGLIPATALARFNSTIEHSQMSDDLALQLADLFNDRENAAAIGREYLQQQPEEADTQLLVQRIFGHDSTKLRSVVELNDLRTIVSGRIKGDYEQESVLAVRGWILSRTELRLCALASLS